MKQFLFLFFIVMGLTASSQQTDLSVVNSAKPKMGQKMAFEAAYKAHVAKFHKGDDKMEVYEVTSGEYAGYYHFVHSGMSYADMDKERADATAHSQDLDKSFFPYLQDSKNATYRMVDSLSLRPDVKADKFIVTIRHLKMDLNAGDFRRELGRTLRIQRMMKGGFVENWSYTHFEKLWDGSDQVIVVIRNLKDGFKSLERDYYGPTPPGTPSFRDEYVKLYGFDAWEERQKVMDGAVVKTEQYTMKRRTDLSSQ